MLFDVVLASSVIFFSFKGILATNCTDCRWTVLARCSFEEDEPCRDRTSQKYWLFTPTNLGMRPTENAIGRGRLHPTDGTFSAVGYCGLGARETAVTVRAPLYTAGLPTKIWVSFLYTVSSSQISEDLPLSVLLSYPGVPSIVLGKFGFDGYRWSRRALEVMLNITNSYYTISFLVNEFCAKPTQIAIDNIVIEEYRESALTTTAWRPLAACSFGKNGSCLNSNSSEIWSITSFSEASQASSSNSTISATNDTTLMMGSCRNVSDGIGPRITTPELRFVDSVPSSMQIHFSYVLTAHIHLHTSLWPLEVRLIENNQTTTTLLKVFRFEAFQWKSGYVEVHSKLSSAPFRIEFAYMHTAGCVSAASDDFVLIDNITIEQFVESSVQNTISTDATPLTSESTVSSTIMTAEPMVTPAPDTHDSTAELIFESLTSLLSESIDAQDATSQVQTTLESAASESQNISSTILVMVGEMLNAIGSDSENITASVYENSVNIIDDLLWLSDFEQFLHAEVQYQTATKVLRALENMALKIRLTGEYRAFRTRALVSYVLNTATSLTGNSTALYTVIRENGTLNVVRRNQTETDENPVQISLSHRFLEAAVPNAYGQKLGHIYAFSNTAIHSASLSAYTQDRSGPSYHCTGDKYDEIASWIVGANFGQQPASPQMGDVRYTVRVTANNNKPQRYRNYGCGYLKLANDSNSYWSTDDCAVDTVNYVSGQISCQCSHLTSLTALVTLQHLPDHILHDQHLYILNCVLIGVSLATLLLAGVLLIVNSTDRFQHIPKMTIFEFAIFNVCIALSCAYTSLLIGIHAVGDGARCTVAGVMIQYFFLSTFTWLSIDAYIMFTRTKSGADGHLTGLKNTKKSVHWVPFLIGWLLPWFFVAIVLTLDSIQRCNSYEGEYTCMLSYSRLLPYLATFIGPIALVLICNFLSFCYCRSKLLSQAKKEEKKGHSNQMSIVKREQYRLMFLFLVLGLPWMSMAFTLVKDRDTLYALSFVVLVLTTTQGIGVFLFVVREAVVKTLMRLTDSSNLSRMFFLRSHFRLNSFS